MKDQTSAKKLKSPGPSEKTHSHLRLFIDRKHIQETVVSLARLINKDFAGKNLIVIGVLKGSFMFLADLIRHLEMPVEVDFVKCSSYGVDTESSGRISLSHRLKSAIEGRNVLLVEDIVDTGLTTSHVLRYLKGKKPSCLKLCALADKVSRRRKYVEIDYRGFEVPDNFMVGYGLDYAQKYRNLPDIYILNNGTDTGYGGNQNGLQPKNPDQSSQG